MEISFESSMTEKLFGDDKKLLKEYGGEMAKRIRRRLDDLIAAPNLAEMYGLPGRIRQYTESKPEMWSLDLVRLQRLLLMPTEPVPRKEGNVVDRSAVTKITICRISDSYGKLN